MELNKLILKVNGIKIKINNEEYVFKTNIKALARLEKNYKELVNGGKYLTFLKILKNNFSFMNEYYKLTDDTELTENQEMSLFLDLFAENVNIYALSVIFYSLLETQMTFDEFSEIDLLDIYSVNFKELFDKFSEDNLEFEEEDVKKKT